MAPDANEAKAQNKANEDAAHKEAREYWGYLIKPDKCGTEIFNRLLEGIADVVSKTFDTAQPCPDLSPTQLAAFYRSVGGNYDVLFIDTPSSSISFIYRSLGAFHSLQPAPDDDGYSSPSVPALKKKGFVAWQTIQLLLGPEEHVGFLQNAVKKYDIKDPQTGNLFPKILPNECLPQEPDDAMEAWYESVAARLKREAEDDAAGKEDKNGPRVHVNIDEHAPRTSSEMSDSDVPDERHAAASYFADPLYRMRDRRPPIVRHFSKEGRDSRRYDEEKENRGRLIDSVRHMLNPFNRDKERDRRKSHPASGRYNPADDGYSDDDDDDNDRTPMATQPPPIPRYTHAHAYSASHKRPHPPRRESSISSTDSDSDSDRPPSRRRTPAFGPSPRRRRSHDAPSAPRDYFPSYYDDRDRRYSHDVPSSSTFSGGGAGGIPLGPNAVGSGLNSRKDEGHGSTYGPTKGPIFATHVAHMQPHIPHHTYYNSSPAPGPDRRPTMPMSGTPLRSSYRASPTSSGVRYTAPPPPAPVPPPPPQAPVPPPPDIHEPVYMRDRDRPRDRERERDRDYPHERERDLSPYSPLSGAGNSRHRRRRSEDVPARERERDRERTTRSHERVRDEWDERVGGSRRGSREPSLSRSRSDGREHDRERDRERERGGRHGYLSTPSSSASGGGGGVEGGVGGRRYPVDAPWR